MSDTYLAAIRHFELLQTLPLIPSPKTHPKILELGAGTGQQSAHLAELGYDVTAIDLATSVYRHERIYPILEYDGEHFPVADESVDIVFTSNVLEHVENLAMIMTEIHRVLRRDGVAIHVLPTSNWRILTTLTHYPSLLQRLVARLCRIVPRALPNPIKLNPHPAKSLLSDVLPRRHGERGNALTECWYFSETWWRRTFSQSAFTVQRARGAGLAYSGGVVFGNRLSIAARHQIARSLGDSARIYVTKPKRDALR